MTCLARIASIALLLVSASTAHAYLDPDARMEDVSSIQIAELGRMNRPAAPRVYLDVFHDNGLVTEFAVRCGDQRGMLTYSREENLFCGPQMRCSTSRQAILSEICRR